MKKLHEGYRPQFMNLTVAGFEQELSPELQALAKEFACHLVDEYNDRKKGCYDLLKRYPNDEHFLKEWTPENIEKFATGENDSQALERLRSKPFNEITWYDLEAAITQDATKATVAVKAIYDGAADYIAMGLYAEDAIGFKEPFKRMEFIVIRNGFIDEWQPRGGIESRLVDMLAQCFVAWQFWLSQSFDVARHLDDVEEQVKKSKTSFESGRWQAPRLSAAEYLDRANQMADRFQRMFLRTLRQMRDLRRYSQPVIVNNAGQVNVATNGGQQINVQDKRKKKGSVPHKKPKPF
jgi:hypothetical protein